MSRLRTVAIPFAGGSTEEIDPRILPSGVFSEVRNGRLPALGSLRLRRGWRPITMNEQAAGATLTACDVWSDGTSLYALCAQADRSALCVATLVEAASARPWTLNTDGGLAPITAVREIGAVPTMATDVLRASAAITSDGVYGCVLEQSSTETIVRVFEMATDETILLTSLSNGSRVRKVVSMGTDFGLIENTGSALVLYSLTPTASAPAFSSVATLFSATVTWFDVAVAVETTPTALHITDVVGGAVSYRKFTFAGSQTGSTKTVSASGALAAAIWCDDAVAHVVYQDSSSKELSLLRFAATGSFTTSAGPTAVNSGVAARDGNFAVGAAPSASVLTAFTREALVAFSVSGDAQYRVRTFNNDHTSAGTRTFDRESFQSGWLVRNFVAACGAVRNTSDAASYQDLNQRWFTQEFGVATERPSTAAPPLWPAQAPTGDALTLFFRETSVVAGVVPKSLSVRAVKVRSTERRPVAALAGVLYAAGGSLTQAVRGALTEQGMLAPVIDQTTPSDGSGSIAVGTYAYRAVLVWEDEAARTHRSAVSDPVEEELAGAEDTVAIDVAWPITLRASSNLIVNPRVEVYRTEAGPGELFYLCGSATVVLTGNIVTVTDLLSDAQLITQPLLYTQGEAGATSGILDACPARPCKYVAATKRRLICAGADTTYQWSQAQFPETQVWFAEPGIVGDPAQAYIDDVEGGAITGVGTLDELAFIGTLDRIYVTGGAGPNLAGVGEFQPPQRLPSDYGFYNHFTILETSEGLWFQGTSDVMCLLPRGAAAPVADHSAQDRLTTASGSLVGCGFDTADCVAVWAAGDATALVRQLDIKQWFGDSLPFTPIAMTSHRGQLFAVASNGVVWRQDSAAFGDGASGGTAVALRVATGPVQPSESTAGWGRLGSIELMGEFRTAAAILAEISYDDGKSWTSLGTHTVSGLTSGDTFQRQWYPARQRGGRFRARFTMTPSSTTAEGCRLTGCTVYFIQKSGPTRLDSAKRR